MHILTQSHTHVHTHTHTHTYTHTHRVSSSASLPLMHIHNIYWGLTWFDWNLILTSKFGAYILNVVFQNLSLSIQNLSLSLTAYIRDTGLRGLGLLTWFLFCFHTKGAVFSYVGKGGGGTSLSVCVIQCRALKILLTVLCYCQTIFRWVQVATISPTPLLWSQRDGHSV